MPQSNSNFQESAFALPKALVDLDFSIGDATCEVPFWDGDAKTILARLDRFLSEQTVSCDQDYSVMAFRMHYTPTDLSSNKPELALGCIGGHGPRATWHFLNLLLGKCRQANTAFTCLTLLLPNTPDRTAALQDSDSEKSGLIRSQLSLASDFLLSNGAKTILMPCNTAHAFIDKKCAIESMIDTCAQFVKQKSLNPFVVLSTEGTVLSELYDTAITGCVLPESAIRNVVSECIYKVKSQGVDEAVCERFLAAVLRPLYAEGYRYFGLCCTELPVLVNSPIFTALLTQSSLDGLIFVDPMTCLIESLVES